MKLVKVRGSFSCALLLVAVCIASPGCGSSKVPPADSKKGSSPVESDAATQTAGGSSTPEPVGVFGTLPPFELTDQSGSPFGTSQLFGKMWIANFIFTRCRATCPQQTAELSEIQRLLSTKPMWNDLRLVSFSVDPEFDTSEVFAQYARAADADPSHWKFLTGPRDEIWRLCEAGFKLPVAEDAANQKMPITHSPKFVLVDCVGRVRGYFDSQSEDGLRALADALDSVFQERVEVPEQVQAPPWLIARWQEQIQAVDQSGVFHDFAFSDEVLSSGIRFRHRILDDSGRDYKLVHYDHGNGLAIADVDGDDLIDVYFTNQAGRNELWKNLGNGKFQDITDEAGVGVADRVSVTASFADIDNDGDPDLYVTAVRQGNLLFENLGAGKFQDTSNSSGLDHRGHSSGAVFFDYDRDGLLDLFLTNVGQYTEDRLAAVTNDPALPAEPGDRKFYVGFSDAFSGHLKPERAESNVLFKNLGERRFVDVSDKVGLVDQTWSGDACPFDANEDGWPDLYVLNMQGDDEFYENVRGEKFVSRRRELFPQTPWGSMGIQVLDFDNDGRLDVFVTDMHSDMSEDIPPEREKLKSRMQWPKSLLVTEGTSIFGNAFFKNDGAATFTEISDQIGAENYWPWGLSSGDFNSDGFEDIFITSSMNYPYRYGVNSLLLNNAGRRFIDSEFVLGAEPRRNGQITQPWFELDCTGSDKERRECRGKTGRAMVWGALGSRSSAVFDFENDGDLDIVTNEFNGYPMVLTSNLAQSHSKLRYLKLKLTGKNSNRDALGARVTVKVGQQTLTKLYHGATGYLSHGVHPLYFGLGDAESADGVEIVFPSGHRQSIPGPIPANSVLNVVEETPP